MLARQERRTGMRRIEFTWQSLAVEENLFLRYMKTTMEIPALKMKWLLQPDMLDRPSVILRSACKKWLSNDDLLTLICTVQ